MSGHISLMGVSHWHPFRVLSATFLMVPSGRDFFLEGDIKVQPGKVAAKGFFYFYFFHGCYGRFRTL